MSVAPRLRTAILLIVAAAVVDLAARQAPAQTPSQQPCDAMCTFIRKVVAEQTTGFTLFKGKELFGVKKQEGRYVWAGTLKPTESPLDSCTLSNTSHTRGTGGQYDCGLRAGLSGAGSRYLTAGEAPAAYAQVVDALRIALGAGWVLSSADSGEGSSNRTMTTTARQTGTKAQVVVRLKMSSGTDAALPTLSLTFT